MVTGNEGQLILDQVTAYLEGADVTDLGAIYPYPPKLTPEGAFYEGADPGHGDGCVMFLHLAAERDIRVAIPAVVGGRKAVEYELAMICFYRSTERRTEDAAFNGRGFLDSLKAAIRADPNMGTGAPPTGDGSGLIFQWGEGTFPGGPDIEATAEFPRMLGGSRVKTSQILMDVRVSVVQILVT